MPYVKTVLKEWRLYCDIFSAKPIIKELHLGGGTPTFFAPEHLKMLIDGIFRHAEKADNHDFSFEGHPNNTTREHLQTLFDLGFRRVSYGVQDYSEKVQKAIHRIQPFENVKRVTEWSREIGYTSVGHDIIFGLPHQQIEDIRETIDRTSELRPDRLAFYSYAHVPWLKGNGQRGFKEEDLPGAEEKRHQYELGKELLTQAGYYEIGMDHFALRSDSLYKSFAARTMHRNFMGYTDSKTQLMVGLGASSISDSWYGFAQNVKSIEEYQHLVAHDIIPIYRGHLLSAEDLIIRRHILNLMCRMETSWEEESLKFNDLELVLDHLQEMELDGLVNTNNSKLFVTEAGRPFVRNVCMAFDLLMHRKAPEKRVFSMTI